MKLRIIILLNKLITLVCRLLGRNASVFPASLVLKLDNNILEKIKYPKYVIGITGSSGKGSTTSLIAHILKENNYKVVWNKSGSNLLNGIATLILNNSSILTTKIKADILLLELDESFIREIFKKSTLTHLIVTNITRDQPARNSTPESIFNKILTSITNDTHLILNGDDSLVNQMTLKHKGKITTYGLDKTIYSINTPISNNIDAAYCPVCNKKLNYRFYHYGHLGNYKCYNCNYQRKLDYKGKKVNLNFSEIIIDNNKVHLNTNVLFAAYYTLAAYTLCKIIGLKEEYILKSLNENISKPKRMQNLKLDNREVIMLESKNENNLSYLQSLNIINQYENNKTIILGFNNVSRRYKYNDLSWLYDIDFNILNTDNIDRIFCIGRFRFDIAARLINSGLNENKIILVNDINNIIDMLKENSTGTIFTMVCFDMTEILKNLFLKEENGENDEN
ncbi:MAG: MurT ligase domain-containing protein [Bacilli bacterium]|nr:MurT ligase domain-containing protein [Bacilli bacterium]